MCVCVAFLFLFGSCTKDNPVSGFLLPDEVSLQGESNEEDYSVDNTNSVLSALAGEEPNSCDCTFWVKSNRVNQSGMVTFTWLAQVFNYNGVNGQSILQVGAGTGNSLYTNVGQWQAYPFSLATNSSTMELRAYVGTQIGNSNLPIDIETKVTCDQAWPAPYEPLKLELSCDAVGSGEDDGCGNQPPAIVAGEVADCGARLLPNG